MDLNKSKIVCNSLFEKMFAKSLYYREKSANTDFNFLLGRNSCEKSKNSEKITKCIRQIFILNFNPK